MLLGKKFFIGTLFLFNESLLAYAFFFELELESSLLLCLHFLGFFKCGTAHDKLCLHIRHKFLKLVHFLLLFGSLLSLVLLFFLGDNFDVLSFLLEFFKQRFRRLLFCCFATLRIQALI